MPNEPTKKCPFCGEKIHAEAIKCRFCREFLEDNDGLPVSHHARRPSQINRPAGRSDEDTHDPDVWVVRPSIWGLLGFFITAVILMMVSIFLVSSPVGAIFAKLFPEMLDEPIVRQVDRYAGYLGVGMAVLTVLIVVLRIAQLKSIHYEISSDRIEYARGIFSRKIDNMDMFRVIDIKLHRSLLDCLVGVGTVTLVTKDETDPVFDFEKVCQPKQLYDIVKTASLKADRKQGVIHLD